MEKIRTSRVGMTHGQFLGQISWQYNEDPMGTEFEYKQCKNKEMVYQTTKLAPS
jgi:hypothetical protein